VRAFGNERGCELELDERLTDSANCGERHSARIPESTTESGSIHFRIQSQSLGFLWTCTSPTAFGMGFCVASFCPFCCSLRVVCTDFTAIGPPSSEKIYSIVKVNGACVVVFVFANFVV